VIQDKIVVQVNSQLHIIIHLIVLWGLPIQSHTDSHTAANH